MTGVEGMPNETVATYADIVLGDRPGVVCLAFGRDPYRDERGKYKHRGWTEVRYAWPADRDVMTCDVMREIATGDLVDVYICPAVRNRGAKARRKGDALPPMVLWADLDGPAKDPALLDELSGFVVASGQEGHLHVYVPLDAPVDLGTHSRLNKALAARLGGDAKWDDAALLRPPGTFNHKTAVPPAGIEPAEKAPVTVVSTSAVRVWSAAELGVKLALTPTGSEGSEGAFRGVELSNEQPPAPLPPLVRWALDYVDGDRSRSCARLVGACLDAHLTLAQTIAVAGAHRPTVEKYGPRLADEVSRFWGKAVDDRQRRSFRSPPGNRPSEPSEPTAVEGSEGSEGAFAGVWDPPTPLPGRTDPIPTDALGPVLQPLVEAIGQCMQVPTDLPANLALPLITTAAKGGWTIEVQPGWTEPLCIATLSALPSGELKTPTLRLLDAPLRKFEREQQALKRPLITQQVAKRKLAEGKVEERRKQALKGLDDGAKEKAYLDAVAELDQLPVDPLPRWLVDDATPEKFVNLLADYGALGAVSDEPGLFGILAGRYSSGAPNIEWLLKATSGAPITVDRIGREGEQVTDPALSIACCIQPGRLVELGQVKAFRDSGLLARWFYVVPRSLVGGRAKTRPVPQPVVDEWSTKLTRLAEEGVKRRDSGSLTKITLADDARDKLEAMRARIEPHLHPDHGRHAGIADWMNKISGNTVRIAAALTLLQDPAKTEITVETMGDAIRVATAYVSHAIAAFGMTRPSAEVHAQAKQVLATIVQLARGPGDPTVSRRAIHQKIRDRAWVASADSLAAPMQVLLDHGHIREAVDERKPGQSGRPSLRFEVHPSHLADRSAP